MYSCGGKIGFFQGDVRKLLDDIKELQPTVFPSVPRLLNRVYDKVRYSHYHIECFIVLYCTVCGSDVL